jgi:hypothetical protein
LPAVKSTDVARAPNHTSRQATCTSGRNLKIIAKSSAITAREPSTFTTWSATGDVSNGPPAQSPSAETAALTTSETISRNPMPNTIATDRRRSLTKLRNAFAFGLGTTSQMRFNASWSWMNTVVAPTRSIARPRMSDHVLATGLRAFSSTVWITSAPDSPTRPRISTTTRPSTASRPNTSPVTATVTSTIGASESSV